MMEKYPNKNCAHYILYSTSACHLCEQAEAILLDLPLSTDIVLEVIDIAEDDQLVAQYGIKIPVLQCQQSMQELCWPFGHTQVQAFILSNTTK
jgi:hypothetical protein